MIVLGLSAATSSLNESSETTVLEEENDSQEVILSLNSLNEPGHQEGSIFTDTTFAAGDYHTCAILDDGSLNCWGRDNYGQLGDGGTNTDKTHQFRFPLELAVRRLQFLLDTTIPAPFLTTVLSTVGGVIATANLVTVEPTPTRTHLFRFPLELAVRRLQFLLEDTTPAPFLTTVLSSVGGGIPTANLVTVEATPTRTHLFRFPLELAVRRLPFLLEMPTPAPFLTTVLSSVGGGIATANLVTVEPTPTRTHLFRFPLELAVRRLQFLLEDTTPAPFLTTVLSSVGGMIPTANLVTVEPTPTRTHLFRFPLELAVRRLQFLLETPTPAPFLTTVLSTVGGVIATANLVTVEPTPTRTHLFRFPLELAVRRLQFLLEMPTPAPFLTTVLSSVGGGITTANLVTVEPTPTRHTCFGFPWNDYKSPNCCPF